MKKIKNFDKTEIYLKAAFRRVWRWSKARRVCLKQAKNICQLCKKKTKKLYADHVEPVCPLENFNVCSMPNPQAAESGPFYFRHIDYNQLFERMFYGKLQAICKTCHTKKTKKENAERKRFKNENKRA